MAARPDRRVRRVLAGHALASLALSLPWPLLLVQVWDRTGSTGLLGLAAAARMLPYVACSWWVGRLADRWPRGLIVRGSLALRVVLLGAMTAALASGRVGLAVLLAALAVAVATPAYPALAAAMPRLAGRESESATHLLVTVEVGSFVVGPALGGLLLVAPSVVGPTAAVATGAALGLLVGVSLPGPVRATGSAPARMGAVLRGSSVLRRCLLVMAGLNLAASATTVALLPMATGGWTAGWADDAAYGVASASLGFGALAAPALMRLGPSPAARVRIGLVVTGAALLVVAWSPSVAWALAPLLVAGAASVHAESAATAVIQAEAPDEVRASLFGLADAVMVAAAMLGSLVAPAVSGWVGPPALLAALGLGVAAGAVGVRAARPDPAVEPLLEESAVS